MRDNSQSWTLYDIDYEGLRVEVKEASRWHPFNEPGRLSPRRSFGIAAPKSVGERQCDACVFCLLTGDDCVSAYPLELGHWKFYVVAKTAIERSWTSEVVFWLPRVFSVLAAMT